MFIYFILLVFYLDLLLFPEILSAEPGLDILKEMHKMFSLLDTYIGRVTMSGVLLSLLENDREKLVKIVIYMQQHDLLGTVNTVRLEGTFLNLFIHLFLFHFILFHFVFLFFHIYCLVTLIFNFFSLIPLSSFLFCSYSYALP